MLVQLSHDAIMVWSHSAGIQSWNHSAELLYGYSQAEAIGQSPFELLGSQYPFEWADIKRSIEQCGEWQGEVQRRAKDGRVVCVSAHYQMAEFSGEHHFVETNRDLFPERYANALEVALQNATDAEVSYEARLRGIYDNSTTFIGLMEVDGTLIEANRTALALIKYP